jgi:hypothetical protein
LASGSRLTTQLLRHRLINSFFPFTSGEKLYPFITPDQLLSSRGSAWVEHWHQRLVLMFLIDCRLPRPPNKHFSLRISNRVTWRNIQRLAPDLDNSDFMAADC